MVDLNEDEKKRREIGMKLKNGQLNATDDIQYFLEQFKDGQYAFGEDDLLKIAELVQKNPEEVTKEGTFRNFFTKGRRTQKAKNIKKQMQNIAKFESRRDIDLVAASLKYDGAPITKEDKQKQQNAIDSIKENIAELGEKGAKNWFMHPRLKMRQWKAKQDLKKIDPSIKENKIAKLRAKAKAFNDKSILKKRADSTLESWYYGVQGSLVSRKANKLDRKNILRKRAEVKAQEVQNLEANVAGSKFFQKWDDKIKLGFARMINNRLQKKVIEQSQSSDLLATNAKLELEIAALNSQPIVTRTDKKRLDANLANKMKLQAKVESRLETLGSQKILKIEKIEATFGKKENKAMAVIIEKTEGIDRKNEKFERRTLEGKVRKRLLSLVSDEKRAELEGVFNARSEKVITADADFKKFLEKAGFKKQDIEKLQGLITSYNEKENKEERTMEREEAPANEAVPENSTKPNAPINVNRDTTVDEYKQIIENDAKKTIILDKSLDAEMKARCIAAALKVEGSHIENMPMISELKDKGANIKDLEAAREKSMKEKAAALTPERVKELRELSLVSKVKKMDDVEYMAFKESNLKKADPEQVKLLDNMRLPKDSEEYKNLTPEDKSKVEKATNSLESLNKNKERKKILAARGVVTTGMTADGKKPSKQKVVANQRIIKENQAQRQFR